METSRENGAVNRTRSANRYVEFHSILHCII